MARPPPKPLAERLNRTYEIPSVTWKTRANSRFLFSCSCFRYMYNEQTNTHLIDSLLYSSLFIAPICFNAKPSSSVSFHSVPAKLRKCVYAVLVLFYVPTTLKDSVEPLTQQSNVMF